MGWGSHFSRNGAGSPMGRDKPDMGRQDLDYAAVLERSAHQIATLNQAVHYLGRYGAAVMQEGDDFGGLRGADLAALKPSIWAIGQGNIARSDPVPSASKEAPLTNCRGVLGRH